MIINVIISAFIGADSMFSLDDEYLQQQSVPLTMMSGSLRKLGQYQGQQALLQHQRPQLIRTLKEIAIIQSSESSNRIEGIKVDPKRLQQIVEKTVQPKNRSEGQVMGYRDVLSQVHNRYKTIEITPETILEMHRDMLKYTDLEGGRWKHKDNIIEERLHDGRWVTRFQPTSAVDTPFYMNELCSRFKRLWLERSIDPFIIVFAFVFDFLCIHPFMDGNGRISRLLTVLLLHKIGIDITRYISYERLVETTKESYYEILQTCSQNWQQGTHRLYPWLEYNIGLLLAGYKELDQRIEIIDSEKGAKTSWVIEMIESLPSEFGIGELVHLCPGVSRPMIRHILERLRNEKKIKSLDRKSVV